MVFNSYIFVLLFFPLVLLIYSVVMLGGGKKRVRWKKLILIFFSVIFYLYAGIAGIGITIALCIGNYFLFCLLHVADSRHAVMRKAVLFLGVLSNLLILIYYKYYNFFIDNINFIFDAKFQISEVIVPLGLSFITFQNVAFLVDTYQHRIMECSMSEYVLYIFYFPKISSGPITLFSELFQVSSEQNKEKFWDNIASGFYLFTMGLGKKVLLADMLAKVTDAGYMYADKLNTPAALLVALSYTFQIYFDFSGYSDMAIGISRMLQIDLADNFNSPYKAKTINEFWDRWHISLTNFFTKYLYIPLGGSRKGKGKTYFNILVVFLCSGLWHGASWTFIIWGGVHGIAMILDRQFRPFLAKIPGLVIHIATFLFVNFTWVIFRAGDFHTLKAMCRALLKGGWGEMLPEISLVFRLGQSGELFGFHIPNTTYIVIFLCIIGIIVFRCESAKERADKKQFTLWNAVWVLAIFMTCLLSFSHVTTYIYARF